MTARQTAAEIDLAHSGCGPSSLRYLRYVPKHESSESLPLLLFLHGAGERGSDVDSIKSHGPPMLIENGHDLPFVVISPQCPFDQLWPNRVMLLALRQLIEKEVTELPIDRARIYCTGLSMGGYGTWAMAAHFPDLFAAIIPICGGGDVAYAGNLAQTPAWAFHGAEDDVVPPERSQELVDAIAKMDGDIKLTIYDNVGHHSWTPAYEQVEIFDWLLQHQKPST